MNLSHIRIWKKSIVQRQRKTCSWKNLSWKGLSRKDAFLYKYHSWKDFDEVGETWMLSKGQQQFENKFDTFFQPTTLEPQCFQLNDFFQLRSCRAESKILNFGRFEMWNFLERAEKVIWGSFLMFLKVFWDISRPFPDIFFKHLVDHGGLGRFQMSRNILTVSNQMKILLNQLESAFK